MFDHWVISLQLYLPVLFASVLLLPIPALNRRRVAWGYSAITSTISFGMTLFVMSHFDWSRPQDVQLAGEVPWIPEFGLTFQFGVDGVSIWLVALTTFLMPVVVLGSLIEVDRKMRTFHFWIHILEACLIGTFIARDVVMFYACFEFSLIPLLFLIGLYGHKNRMRAAKVYFYYAFTGSVFLLVGIGYLMWFHTTVSPDGRWTANIAALTETAQQMSLTQQSWLLLAFLAGFAIKTPLWPFHTWLPLAHTEAPTAGSVDLAGLVLKLGPYGLLLLAIPMAPQAAVRFAPYLGVFAVVGIVVTALICWVQTDAKKLIAYSSVSHMGFCILGLFAFDDGDVGATGAVFYLLAHGLASGGLFLCLGMLYDRFHTRDMRKMSGLAKELPLWSFFFVLFALAAVGLPGLNGFVGEFLTMLGTANSPDGVLGMSYAVVAATGVILAAIYMLFIVGKMVFGPLKLPPYVEDVIHEHGMSTRHVHGMSWREILTLAPLGVVCVVLGLFPSFLLSSIEPAVQARTAAARQVIADRSPAPAVPAEQLVLGAGASAPPAAEPATATATATSTLAPAPATMISHPAQAAH